MALLVLLVDVNMTFLFVKYFIHYCSVYVNVIYIYKYEARCQRSKDVLSVADRGMIWPRAACPYIRKILKVFEHRHQVTIVLKKKSLVCCDHFINCNGKLDGHRLTKVKWRTSEQGATDGGGASARKVGANKRRRQEALAKEEETSIRADMKRLKEDRLAAEKEYKEGMKKLQKRIEELKGNIRAFDLPHISCPRLETLQMSESQQLVIDLSSECFYQFANFPTRPIFESFIEEALPYIRKHRRGDSDATTRLKVTLFVAASGLSASKLGQMGLVSRTTLSSWVKDIASSMVKSAMCRKYVRLLTDEEWEKEMERYEEYRGRYVLIFTDGSVLETVECADPALARAMRSGKHCIPCYVFFVVVSPRGRVVYVSDYVVGGAVHDSVHWQVSDVVERLKEAYPEAVTATGKRRAVSGDKAYPCIDVPENWQLIITKTGETDVPEFGDDNRQNEEMTAVVKELQERYALRDRDGSELPGVSFELRCGVCR